MVDKCRNELKARNNPILCECHDGKWLRLCMFNEKGFPLSCLQLQHLTWGKAKNSLN